MPKMIFVEPSKRGGSPVGCPFREIVDCDAGFACDARGHCVEGDLLDDGEPFDPRQGQPSSGGCSAATASMGPGLLLLLVWSRRRRRPR